jgi:enoyl-CoA hydratase/carnithine racemase
MSIATTAARSFADPRLARLDGFRVEIDRERERADMILDRPPFNIIEMPHLNDTEDAMLSTAIELEGHCYSRLRQSDDFREGVEAFHAKRPAKFRGS